MTDRYGPEDESGHDAKTGGTPASAEMVASKRSSAQSAADPAIRQLDSIIENLASYAAPVLREVASDLRRDTAVAGSASGTAPLEPVEQTPAEEEAGLPPR